MTRELDRRAFIGTAAVTSVGFLAGCGGSSDNGGASDDPGTEDNSGSTPAGSAPSDVTDYLSDADNFGGSVQDETGSGSVSVDVGAEGNGGNYAFAPPAIRVNTGTTVTWTWTGKGQSHNVVDEDGAFESKQTDEEGFEFEYTFEEAGTYLYYCTPHKGLGMKGAIVVE